MTLVLFRAQALRCNAQLLLLRCSVEQDSSTRRITSRGVEGSFVQSDTLPDKSVCAAINLGGVDGSVCRALAADGGKPTVRWGRKATDPAPLLVKPLVALVPESSQRRFEQRCGAAGLPIGASLLKLHRPGEKVL